MGSGYTRNHGKSWTAKWRDGDGEQQTLGGFATKQKAEQYATEQEELSRAGHVPFDRRTRWNEFKPRWLEVRGEEGSTTDSDTGRIEKWLVPQWGDVPLIKVTQHDTKKWVLHLRKQALSPASIHRIFYLFSASMKKAVEDGIIPINPCAGVHGLLPPAEAGEVRAYTLEQVWLIADTLTGPYRDVVLWLAYTGMRFGELAGLHWSEVNLNTNITTVRNSWTRAGGMKPYPKGRRRREVPLPDVLLEALQLERPADWRQPCGLDHPPGDKCTGQLVFRGPLGGPMDARNMRRRHWLPALVKLGLIPGDLDTVSLDADDTDDDDLDHFGKMHGLRHTYVSYLRSLGLGAVEVGKVVGHTSNWVTERYTHLFGSTVNDVRDAMNAAGRGVTSPVTTDQAGNTVGYISGNKADLKIVSGGL